MSGERHSADCTHWQCAPGCDVMRARLDERFGPFIEPLPLPLPQQSERKRQWSMAEDAAKEAAERLTANHANACACELCVELRKTARKLLRKRLSGK